MLLAALVVFVTFEWYYMRLDPSEVTFVSDATTSQTETDNSPKEL